jgi:dTMP kinase
MHGKFITFEGPEGSGKTTHIARLSEFLCGLGIDVVATREPGGTALGEKIRALIQHSAPNELPFNRTELLLFLASRAQHVDELIRPSLQDGKWVLCDRFSDSTMAYQGYGRGLDLSSLRMLDAFATADLKPDLTLLIDVSSQTSLARLVTRHSANNSQPDRIEAENASFHSRLRRGFHSLAEIESTRFKLIDAEREPEIVQSEIRACVTQRFLSTNTYRF